jgi:precorrin-3B synthase
MSATAPKVRGWCPGALRPMESGDGLIVRVRPRCGRLEVGDVITLANAAERHGNGLIDLTRRANLQIRGLTPERLPGLWEDLSHGGLIDESADVEAVRNVMVSPLAQSAVGAIAGLLEEALIAEPALWQLPAKFCFIVDDEETVLSLDEERADIRLKIVRVGGGVRVAIGCGRPDGVVWLGATSLDTAAEAAVSAVRAFLSLRGDARMRLRDLAEPAFRRLQRDLTAQLEPMTIQPAQRAGERTLGLVLRCGTVIAVGIAAPFGRIDAQDLRAIAAAAQELGVAEFHLSPWRSLYLRVADAHTAEALLGAATAHSFIVDLANPLASIDACPGAPGCRSSLVDTRSIAVQLAPLLEPMGWRSCHVSGCSKGCARSKPADLVLVGTSEGLAVMRYDTAQGVPRMLIPPARLSELPDILRTV